MIRFSPAALLAYDGLEKAAALQMLDAIDDAVDLTGSPASCWSCERIRADVTDADDVAVAGVVFP